MPKGYEDVPPVPPGIEVVPIPEGFDPLASWDDEQPEDGPCELCGSVVRWPVQTESCENCNLFLCPSCWGPRAQDDLYVGWCHSCAG